MRRDVDLPSQRHIPSERRICGVSGLSRREGKKKPGEKRTDHKSSQSHKEQRCRGGGLEGTFRSFDVT